MRKPNGLISRFLSHERGNVAMLFAMSAIPVFGITGLAVDYSRAINVRAQVQAAVDAAAVAAVRLNDESDANRIAAAEKSFAANIEGMSNSQLSVKPTVTYADNTATVTASGDVETTVGAFLGVKSFKVDVGSTASSRSNTKIEVAMAIDLSGSMGDSRNGQTKIAGLRAAGADLVNVLLPKASSTPNTRVAIVPFADYVNAGDYAVTVTGLPSNGSYTPATDLAGTKNGRFTGTYSGTTGNTPGSESGVTPQNITYPGQTSSAGTVYKNDYCGAAQTGSVASSPIFDKVDGATRGVYINPFSGGTYAGPAPAGLLKWTPSDKVVLTWGDMIEYKSRSGARYRPGSYLTGPNDPDHWVYLYNTLNGPIWMSSPYVVDASNTSIWGPAAYYVPHVVNPVGLTPQMRTAKVNRLTPGRSNTILNGVTNIGKRTGPVGAMINIDDSIEVPAPAVNAATNGYGGYWFVEGINDDGTLGYYWQETGYYIPLYKSFESSSSSNSACSTTPNTGPLITCVTERTGPEDYSDADPTSNRVGAYNHGDGSISNYSSDGKCWTAGRELPKVIPLTNDKKTLTDFFDKAEFGGGTPGHLGTAWAWYTLSPKWNAIWPWASKAADYSEKDVSKSVVIVTDGEYNMEYSSDSSRTQALALCKAMKDKGVTIYTVGIGFSTSSTASDSSADGKAKDLLTQCASSAKHAYFPADGTALQQNLTDIGGIIKSRVTVTTARMTQ